MLWIFILFLFYFSELKTIRHVGFRVLSSFSWLKNLILNICLFVESCLSPQISKKLKEKFHPFFFTVLFFPRRVQPSNTSANLRSVKLNIWHKLQSSFFYENIFVFVKVIDSQRTLTFGMCIFWFLDLNQVVKLNWCSSDCSVLLPL